MRPRSSHAVRRLTRSDRITVILITGKTRIPPIGAPCQDKGGAGSGISGLYLWDRQKYIDEAMPQLNDSSYYRLLDFDATDTSQQIQHTLDERHAREVLTDKTYEFLSPTDCKPARFYHQPNLHTESLSRRPIVSGNGSPTENISLFVDNLI